LHKYEKKILFKAVLKKENLSRHVFFSPRRTLIIPLYSAGSKKNLRNPTSCFATFLFYGGGQNTPHLFIYFLGKATKSGSLSLLFLPQTDLLKPITHF